MLDTSIHVLGEERRRVAKALVAGAAFLLQAGFLVVLLNAGVDSDNDVLLAGAVAMIGSAVAMTAALVLGRTPRVKVAGSVVQVGTGVTAATFDLRGASALAVEQADRRGVRWRKYAHWSPLLTDRVPERSAVRLRVRDGDSGSWFLVPLHDAQGLDLRIDQLQDVTTVVASLSVAGTGLALAVIRQLVDRSA